MSTVDSMATDDLTSRTTPIFGDDLIKCLKDTQFCILGCGAVGTIFAEMLVRSGAENLSIVDGDIVQISNLNRSFSFSATDAEKKKVDVLKSTLEGINPAAKIKTYSTHLPLADDINSKIIHSIANAGAVVIAMDCNAARRHAEKFCRKFKCRFMSIGLHFGKDEYSFEVVWDPITPEDSIYENDGGYGEGSYIAPLMEACAVGFQMLLSHMQKDGCKQKRVLKTFPYFSATARKEEVE